MTGPKTPGTIITFYSYKGGTGRTMALANLAWVLASNDKKVLLIDWDLEAPGLHRYLRPFLIDPELQSTPGLIDFVWDLAAKKMTPAGDNMASPAETDLLSLEDYAVGLDWNFAGEGAIAFVPAGRQDEDYPQRVNTFDWDNFYERLGGGKLLHATGEQLRRDYNYILIDSRTGVSDTSGICTVQMPDMLVICFTLNHQSVRGAAAVAASVQKQREPDFRIYPVPTRLENAETDKLETAMSFAKRMFSPFLSHVQPKQEGIDFRTQDMYWADVSTPYRTFYAFEEVPAAFKDQPGRHDTILASIERLSRWITNGEVSGLKPVDEARCQAIVAAYAFANQEVPGHSFALEPLSDFAPAYEIDLFVSYAHLDDEPVLPEHAGGWVATFVRHLKLELALKVGSVGGVTVWFDSLSLRADHRITSETAVKVERSAVFLAIQSPAYLASQWCREEARLFTQHFAGDLAGRVFIVEKEPIGEEPAVELGGRRSYRFWYRDRDGRPRTLGQPMPQQDEIEYFRQVADLARDIHAQLRTMRDGPAARFPASSSGGDAAVFLAEVTDDLEFRRLELRRYLEQQGILVLPQTAYPLGRAEFEAWLNADLARSRLFVQLLGPMPGRRPPDVQDGYGWLQFECARRRGMRILQWRSPELDLAGIEWPRQRELLELETVQATSLETFKSAVAEALAPAPPQPQLRSSGDQPLVFLNTEPRHGEIAAKIRNAIRDRAALLEPLREGPAEEVRVDFEQNLIDCDAMVMVYADNVGWACAQLRAFLKSAPRRERPVRAIPVIDAPADSKPELGFYMPEMVIIDARGGVGSEVLARLSEALRL
jgi:TIR domain/AAA domain